MAKLRAAGSLRLPPGGNSAKVEGMTVPAEERPRKSENVPSVAEPDGWDDDDEPEPVKEAGSAVGG
jgi:hypothetical protein